MMLHRYWLRFNLPESFFPRVIRRGVGVTAPDLETALKMVYDKIFQNIRFPELIEVIEDVDISALDPDEIRPNMALPTSLGIWFPLGYQ